MNLLTYVTPLYHAVNALNGRSKRCGDPASSLQDKRRPRSNDGADLMLHHHPWSDDCTDRVHGLTTKPQCATSFRDSEWGKTAQAPRHRYSVCAVPCATTISQSASSSNGTRVKAEDMWCRAAGLVLAIWQIVQAAPASVPSSDGASWLHA